MILRFRRDESDSEGVPSTVSAMRTHQLPAIDGTRPPDAQDRHLALRQNQPLEQMIQLNVGGGGGGSVLSDDQSNEEPYEESSLI